MPARPSSGSKGSTARPSRRPTASARTCSRASFRTRWPTSSSAPTGFPINADSGFHTDFADLPDHMPFATTKDYENYIARLNAFPAYVGAEIALMREGITARFTLPQVVLEGYDVTMTTHVVAVPEKSVFFAPFRGVSAGRARGGARAADRGRPRGRSCEGAVAGYRTLSDFMKAEYVPRARATIGASRAAEGPRVLRLPRAPLHDARPHARPGPRDRPAGGPAHPRRDGRRDARRPASRATSPPS